MPLDGIFAILLNTTVNDYNEEGAKNRPNDAGRGLFVAIPFSNSLAIKITNLPKPLGHVFEREKNGRNLKHQENSP